MSERPPWWRAEIHAGRRPLLLIRSRIKAALRAHFEREGFIEIEAAALQVSPGNETHLHAFATEMIGNDGLGSRMYLHTSPEFAAKKLLTAGEERIFDFARVFRNRERSAVHHPEFTLLEWYRARRPYEAIMRDCAVLLRIAADTAETRAFRYRGNMADPAVEPELLSVCDAFHRYARIDLIRSLPTTTDKAADRTLLAAQAHAIGLRTAADDTWSDIFSRIISDRIEPNLGIGRATILYEYPASEAALARRKPDDPRFAERFELYVCGVELANAFGELTDPVEQRRRFEDDMDEKQRIYGERYPIDEELLQALQVMPPASGIALGFDRLVMLATGASHIEEVIWTPVPERGTST